MKYKILIFFCLSSIFSFSQYRKNDGNRIGITAGMTRTSLFAKGFSFKSGYGWIGGLSVRGNFYNDKWSMLYGMQFTESQFSLLSKNVQNNYEDVNYKLSGAQIRIIGSYHLIEDNLALDFGPVLQINGKLKLDDSKNSNIINDSSLKASDITDVSKVNINVYLGLSAGGKIVRASIFYQLGVNNFFSNLNNEELKLLNNNKSFNAHMGMMSGQLTFNL